MDNMGGIKETNLFAGDGRVSPAEVGAMTPEFEQGRAEKVMGAEQGRDPRLENAIGVATVGATGVTPEREEQLVEQAFRAPNDIRTEEEVRIGAPEVAKDGDRMEKEWMEKARELVRETKNDPHQRLVGAALLREEYMRKRFNRILGERN